MDQKRVRSPLDITVLEIKVCVTTSPADNQYCTHTKPANSKTGLKRDKDFVSNQGYQQE